MRRRGVSVYLEKVVVHGFRAASEEPLECILPGRFSVLTGANSAGKSTISDAIVLAHRDVFPFKPRHASAVLSHGIANRTIDVGYALEDPEESPLGKLCDSTISIPAWTTSLSTSMGRVAASSPDALGDGQLPLLYLSPTRNPAQELAGRDARLVVELLRAQALRDRGDKSLSALRGLLGGLVSSVVSKWPVDAAEDRVRHSLADLTDGIAGRAPFLGATSIDDTFLARVFEFLLAGAGMSRADARRLETEGLGYANLLQIAVVLAAIPDLTETPPDSGERGDPTDEAAESEQTLEDEDAEQEVVEEDERSDDDRRELMREAEARREEDDDTFFANVFHAVVLLEEPEAHLHPQLQHGLVQYLKEVVEHRPEVQVVVTTHSDEIVAACDPEDLVVLRRDGAGVPTARTIKSLNLAKSKMDQARRHLDVNRSASLFAERAVLVEGVTDAIVLRAVALVWAGSDRVRRRFVQALTVSVVGSRIGPWLPDLLTSPGNEIVDRLAVLRDSDRKPEPAWIANRAGESFHAATSDPTLEPAITPGNEDLVKEIINAMVSQPKTFPDDDELPEWVADWFKKGGRHRKARFADEFAAACRRDPASISVPAHLEALLDFVWEGFLVDEVLPDEKPSVEDQDEES